MTGYSSILTSRSRINSSCSVECLLPYPGEVIRIEHGKRGMQYFQEIGGILSISIVMSEYPCSDCDIQWLDER